MNKWLMIGLVGCALAIFGYLAYSGQRTKASTMGRGPISVAAVRGGTEGADAPVSGAASNAVVDYTSALQDDVALAKKRTDEYNAASKARADAVRKSVAETEAQ